MISNTSLSEVVRLSADGRLNDALSACQSILKDQPNQTDALFLFSVLNAKLGQEAEAIKSLEKLVELAPRRLDALQALGTLQIKNGDYSNAESTLLRAVELAPNVVDLHIHLSTTQSLLKKWDAAADSAEIAVELSPDNYNAHVCGGKANQALRRFDLASVHFQRALELQPQSLLAHTGLCEVALQTCRFKDACNLVDRADSLFPFNAKLVSLKASALIFLGKPKDGIDSLQQIDTRDQAFASSFAYVAGILLETGRIDQALELINYAMLFSATDPDLLTIQSSIYEQTNLRKSTNTAFEELADTGPRITKFEAILERAAPKSRDSFKADFALSRLYRKEGKTSDFFQHLHSANAKKKALNNYHIGSDVELFDRLRNAYEEIKGEQVTQLDLEAPHRRPIFIVGMPRSGTTLAEQILSSHRDVYGSGELIALGRSLKPRIDGAASNNPLDPQTLSELAWRYRSFIAFMGNGEPIITDKMPTNFRFIGFANKMLPDAKFINLNRDPRAVCWSNYSIDFVGMGNGFADNLSDLAHYFRLYLDLMDYWRAELPNKIYDLNYEALTENQEFETRRLLEFCELEWDDACLNFQDTRRAVKTASQSQVRKSMYKGSSQAWREFEPHLQELIDGLKQHGIPLPN